MATMRPIKGATRWVWIVGKYAIKLPSFYSFRNFLNGLLANMQEKEFSTTGHEKLCPVLFCAWGGFLLVMPRCTVITEQQFDKIEASFEHWTGLVDPKATMLIPVECKQSSFGWYKGRIVAIDYG